VNLELNGSDAVFCGFALFGVLLLCDLPIGATHMLIAILMLILPRGISNCCQIFMSRIEDYLCRLYLYVLGMWLYILVKNE